MPEPAAPGSRVLIARAERARDVLPDGLAARGYEVEVLPVYRTVTVEPDPDALAKVRRGDVSAITFTSSSTVRNFFDLVGPLPDPQPRVVSIGPVTSQTARDLGLRVDAEAAEHTIDGLVATLAGMTWPEEAETPGGTTIEGRALPRAASPPSAADCGDAPARGRDAGVGR